MEREINSISVAMATYNGEKFLYEQIKSIIAQTCPPTELIVCDDCSSDNTIEILKYFSDKINLRIYHNKQRQGPIKSFESAIRGCTSNYIAIADQDDIWLPKKLELSLQRILLISAQYPPKMPLLVFSDLKVVSENLEPLAESYWRYSSLDPNKHSLARLLTRNCITGCTILMNKELSELALPFGKNTLMHDYWLALTASAFGKIDYLPSPTILYRQHDNNYIGARPSTRVSYSISRKFKFLQRYLIQHEFDGYLNKNILQASDFLEQFSQKLKTSDHEKLKQFISLSVEGGLSAVFKMLKYGFLLPNISESIELLFKYGCRKK